MFNTTDMDKKDLYQPETQKREPSTPGILIVTGNKVEDLEFFYPYYRFIEAGYRVDVATPEGGAFEAKHGLKLKSSMKLKDVKPKDYALLYLPGGKAPEELKKNHDALALVKFFAKNQMPIAAVCHGPQLLAAADVARGRRIAAWPEVQDELVEAGATYENAEVFCDENFITARWPGDLPAHVKEVLKCLDACGAATRGMAA